MNEAMAAGVMGSSSVGTVTSSLMTA